MKNDLFSFASRYATALFSFVSASFKFRTIPENIITAKMQRTLIPRVSEQKDVQSNVSDEEKNKTFLQVSRLKKIKKMENLLAKYGTPTSIICKQCGNSKSRLLLGRTAQD